MPRGLEPPAKLGAKLAPKAAKPRGKPSAKPAAEVAVKPATKLAARESILVAYVEHVQLFNIKYSRQRSRHIDLVPPSVELDMHPNRQFLPRLWFIWLHSNPGWGSEGTVTWDLFPQGCEDAVTRRWLVYQGGRVHKGGGGGGHQKICGITVFFE